jgi:hypothetical protein
MNVEVEIYVSQMVSFFEKNPSDLFKLIGGLDKTIFYKRIKEKAEQNFKEIGDVPITQKQMIDIIVEMNNDVKKFDVDTSNIFIEGKLSSLCLN